MDSLLKKMVYNVVKCSQPTTKKEVKSNVYDLALKTGLLTKDLVLAFGDISNIEPATVAKPTPRINFIEFTRVTKLWQSATNAVPGSKKSVGHFFSLEKFLDKVLPINFA